MMLDGDWDLVKVKFALSSAKYRKKLEKDQNPKFT